jgi:hypothetical protein
MGIGRAFAKVDDINRRVLKGRRTDLKLIDRETREVLGTVREWTWEELNPSTTGKPTHIFKMTLGGVVTREILQSCGIAFNGLIHDVLKRHVPDPQEESVQAIFRTLPTNERIY